MTKKVTIQTLLNMKQENSRISCLTAYDSTHAWLASTNGIDVMLVGDSLGMVVQGQSTTIPVTMEQMIYHTRCVSRGNQGSFLMADMPYMAHATVQQTLDNSALLMQAGADMVKLEGGQWLCESVQKLAERGIPTCLHLGLTPQSVAMYGGFKVQGRSETDAQRLLEDAKALESAGANIILLECVPASLAARVTNSISVPVIGIGAGPDTDGQILVFYDALGMTTGRTARFVKNFMEGVNSPQAAIARYNNEVKEGVYPQLEHTYES